MTYGTWQLNNSVTDAASWLQKPLASLIEEEWLSAVVDSHQFWGTHDIP